MLNSPIAEASTLLFFANSKKASRDSTGTEKVMRSWDSLTINSKGERPGYLTNAFSRSTTAPFVSWAISPTLELKPPAPLSVTLLNNPNFLASIKKSPNLF